MSCRDCVFRGIFQDMGASCDVCNLQVNLADAVKACENSASCRHRFTVSEAKKIVMEREGGLPVIEHEKEEQGEEPDPKMMIKEGLERVAEAARKALEAIRMSSASLVKEELENFKKKEEERANNERFNLS